MKQDITRFLQFKNPKEFHPLNELLKTLTSNDEAGFKRIKKTLKELEESGEVEVSHPYDHLGIVDGVTYSHPDGTAAPARYHDLDSVNISARGLGQKIEAAPIEYLENGTVNFPEAPSYEEMISELNSKSDETIVNELPATNGHAPEPVDGTLAPTVITAPTSNN